LPGREAVAIEWRANLETGNETIDNQHKELFSRFNRLLEACNRGKGKEEVGNLLSFLSDYVKSHFAAEEQLQVRHDYPHYKDHKKMHDEFIVSLKNVHDEFNSEGAGIAVVIQTNKIILDWLIKHISGTDKELATFLNTRA
jgi:hemerythrin